VAVPASALVPAALAAQAAEVPEAEAAEAPAEEAVAVGHAEVAEDEAGAPAGETAVSSPTSATGGGPNLLTPDPCRSRCRIRS
jgi:hypothetical protein